MIKSDLNYWYNKIEFSYFENENSFFLFIKSMVFLNDAALHFLVLFYYKVHASDFKFQSKPNLVVSSELIFSLINIKRFYKN